MAPAYNFPSVWGSLLSFHLLPLNFPEHIDKEPKEKQSQNKGKQSGAPEGG
jgi:hypothetical protein